MAPLVVIVTGANSGIGLHMSRTLLQDACRVAGFDLAGDNLAALQDQYPQHLRYYCCDVTDAEQINGSVAAVVAEWGRIDVLVNNACVVLFKPFEERTLEETRQEFEVNYFGYLRTIQAVLPHMKRQGGGVIHNLSSGVGISGFPGISGYASTKGAIEALTRTLALEFEPLGIRVNLMHPPLTDTASAAGLGVPPQMMADPAEVGRKLAKKIASRRPVITPDFQSALGLFFVRHFPTAMGRLLSYMARRAQREAERARVCDN